MEQLVGRIALYPDDLVAVILPASTNPLQLVQAERFLEQRKSNPKLEVDAQWDDAVKTLCNYPDVVKMMSQDLDWTTELAKRWSPTPVRCWRRSRPFAGGRRARET